MQHNMSNSIGRELRAQQRARLLNWRRGISPSDRAVWDALIGTRLLDLIQAHHAQLALIAVYRPTRGEPIIDAVLDPLRRAGHRLALPRVIARDRALEFGVWDEQSALRADRFGVDVCEPHRPALPDLLVIPCVGFDRRCYRLGFGAGFYDRTLAERPITAIGVAYQGCMLDEFEPAAHDRALNFVVTESMLWAGSGPD